MAKKEVKQNEGKTVDNTVEKLKVKKKPSMKKMKTYTDGVTKVDLTKLIKEAVSQQGTNPSGILTFITNTIIKTGTTIQAHI